MSHDSAEDGTKSMDEENAPPTLQEDFEILTERMTIFGRMGSLRRAPLPPELQLDGSCSWVRRHQLEYRDGKLTLRTTDNRCVISHCSAVHAEKDVPWVTAVDSEQFNRLMPLIHGAKHKVVLEDRFLRFSQSGQNLRLPLCGSMQAFPTPPEPNETSGDQVSRAQLVRSLAFLLGGKPHPSSPDPSDIDKTQTVSLYHNGVAMAHDKGVDRMTDIPALPFDIHVATIHARRLCEWIKMLESDILIARAEDGAGRSVICFRDGNCDNRMWLPMRLDGMIRQKVENACHQPIVMQVQVKRRPFCGSLRLLSTLALGQRIILHLHRLSGGTIRVRLLTPKQGLGGAAASWGEDQHDARGVLDMPETDNEVWLETGVPTLRAAFNRFKGKFVTLAYRQGGRHLSIQASKGIASESEQVDQSASEHSQVYQTQSMIRVKAISAPASYQ